MVCSYNPLFLNLPLHLNAIDKTIEVYSITYYKILIAGDFNAQASDTKLDTFCSIWNLKRLGREPACFDLFLTSTVRSFQETGLLEFHNLVVTVLKSTFSKSPQKIKTYRSYKNFSNNLLRDDLNFLNHVPANHANFMTKDLRKMIMLRFRLPNIFLKEKSLESKMAYNKQHNICVSMVKKLRENTFGYLNIIQNECHIRKTGNIDDSVKIFKIFEFGFDSDSLNFNCNYLLGWEQKIIWDLGTKGCQVCCICRW